MTRKSTNKHIRVYLSHHGEIPKDSDGRIYDIHHIDGDHENNDIDNLVALSIQDHYDVHYQRGDWAACMAIRMRMDLDPNAASDLMKRRYEEGTHPVQTMSEEQHREISSLGGQAIMKKLREQGHESLAAAYQTPEEIRAAAIKGGEMSRPVQKKLLEDGKHPFQAMSKEERLKNSKKAGAVRGKQLKELAKIGENPFQKLTREQKQAAAKKAWITRRAKKLSV